jgi:hypothetical protein
MFTVPYGKQSIQFSLPSTMRVTQAISKAVPPIEEVSDAVAKALACPVGSRPLREIVQPGNRVCVVFTDITRSCPDRILIPPILKELEAGGVRDNDITLLCGIGMHRPSTTEEKVAKLGADIVNRYRVIDNEPQNPAALIDLGKTVGGVPVSVHHSVMESNVVIATGIVEPHQYAGYSGGRKTLAVGAAGEELIAYTHGPAFVDHPGTRLGQIEGNPFHEAVTEAARRAGLRFIINVVLDDNKRLLRVTAGDPSWHSGIWSLSPVPSMKCRYRNNTTLQLEAWDFQRTATCTRQAALHPTCSLLQPVSVARAAASSSLPAVKKGPAAVSENSGSCRQCGMGRTFPSFWKMPGATDILRVSREPLSWRKFWKKRM